MPTAVGSLIPAPLPYHQAIVQHLQAEEPALWKWFASTRKRQEGAEAIRLDLLKSTYRLEPASQPQLYEQANVVRDLMALSCTLTLYQAQAPLGLNASLAYLPGEAHVTLAGPLAEVLSEAELLAVLAHELAHFLFFDEWNGDYLVAAELLRALSADAAGPAFHESSRFYTLWTEVFADRWACHLCGDMTAAISALIRINTGLSEVSVPSYLRQADEILSKERAQVNQLTHPELYIRARALKLWHEQGDDAHAEIERMIEGPPRLQQLDLLGRQKTVKQTREFLNTLLSPAWFRTEPILAHAKQFFPDYAFSPTPSPPAPVPQESDPSVRDYYCYLMLDFVTVDRDLGDVALSAALVLARKLGLEQRFAELAQKELGLSKKAFAKIDKEAESLLAKTEASQRS